MIVLQASTGTEVVPVGTGQIAIGAQHITGIGFNLTTQKPGGAVKPLYRTGWEKICSGKITGSSETRFDWDDGTAFDASNWIGARIVIKYNRALSQASSLTRFYCTIDGGAGQGGRMWWENQHATDVMTREMSQHGSKIPIFEADVTGKTESAIVTMELMQWSTSWKKGVINAAIVNEVSGDVRPHVIYNNFFVQAANSANGQFLHFFEDNRDFGVGTSFGIFALRSRIL